MVVPVGLDPGRRDPRSPYYEETKEERRVRRAEEREAEAKAEKVERFLIESDCRKCGAENDNRKPVCSECEL